MHLIYLGDKVRGAGEDAVWLLRERVAWPVEDAIEPVEPRALIGVFGGGGIAVAGVVAALLISSPGSGAGGGTTAAPAGAGLARATATAPAPAPAATPKKKAVRVAAPTLHGAPPDFSPAKDVKAGVGDGNAVEEKRSGESEAKATGGAAANADDAPAATAKIGSDPTATASSAAPAESPTAGASVAGTGSDGSAGDDEARPGGSPAPRAAKRVARRFAEAFVVYETGGIDARVRDAFGATSTEQLSKSLLHRPPRQPADVKVPRAKVVNVVAGPSANGVYSVSVSLLRVGVTSELRLELEQGPGKQWQVTNVLG